MMLTKAAAAAGVLAAVLGAGTATGCDALRSQPARTVAGEMIDLALAQCVAEADSLDEVLIAVLCKTTAEVIRPLVASKRVGLMRIAAKRASGRPLDDGGYP